MKLIPKNEAPPSSADEPKPIDPRQAAYHWLSQVEDLCRKAFLPDEAIIARSRAKIASRSRPLKTVKVDVPKKVKEQLHVLPVAGALDSWLARLDEPMSKADEQKAGEQASRGMANRDLLAHRIGRPSATIRWQGCPTDEYNKGARAYRRRLAAVGHEIAALGYIPEPANHPWRQKRQESEPDMSQREADAEANAAAWAGDNNQ